MSRTRTASFSSSSLTSISTLLRDVRRQALDLEVAVDEVEDAALLLDALRLALDDDRDGHRQQLVHRDAIEVGVQQLVASPGRPGIP